MNIETAKANFPKGQRVAMQKGGVLDYIDGNTMEDVCQSDGKFVVRVKWEDKSESIEDIKSLHPQPDLSFLFK